MSSISIVRVLLVCRKPCHETLLLITFGLLVFATVPVMAADCPTLVQQALAATDTMCGGTGKNQACYGNINLTATPTFGAENFRFSQPGDRVNVTDIKSLQLSPMTVDTGEWGVALMNIEASLPAAKPSTVTLLAFGDVMLENAAPAPTTLDVNIVGGTGVNVRLMPNMNSGVVGSLQPNQTVTVLERLVDGSWLRVQLPDSEQMGWLKSDYVSAAGDLRTLNIVDGTQPHYRPMQAFTFKSGSETQGCTEIPEDGLIIQTPEGAGEVQLWINQVVVKLGSTVYFQAQPNNDMVVTTLEGHATVEAQGVAYTAGAGSSVSVKLDADMNAAAPPAVPQAYEMSAVADLPIDQLPRKITIHEPLTEAQILEVQRQYLGTVNQQNNQPNMNSGGNNNSNNGCCQNPPTNNNSNGNAAPPAAPPAPPIPVPPVNDGKDDHDHGHKHDDDKKDKGKGHNHDDDD